MNFKSFVITVCLSISLSAQKQPTLIPFSLENNSVYLHCKVNEIENLKFLFDTGADGSVININAKKKVKLKIDGKSQNKGSNGVNTVDYSSHNTVQFGDLKKTEVSFALIPYGEVNFDGVFGTDLMKGKIIEIDYHKNLIRFYDENEISIDFSGYEKMKLHLIDNYPAVESSITVNGKEYSGLFGLDSGADDALTITSPYTRKNSLANIMKTIGKATAQGSDGTVYEMPVVLCPSITFAHRYLYNIPITLASSHRRNGCFRKNGGFLWKCFFKEIQYDY